MSKIEAKLNGVIEQVSSHEIVIKTLTTDLATLEGEKDRIKTTQEEQ